MTDRNTKTSKFLSYVLRHRPQAIGLTLGPGGWVDTDHLIALANAKGRALTLEHLREVVATNNKKRFTFSPDGSRIRAAQGHSIPVELGLERVQPPERLFHGTATRFLGSILAQGLLKKTRQHVHLSPDVEPASAVGRRHGELVLLEVAARAMAHDGLCLRSST